MLVCFIFVINLWNIKIDEKEYAALLAKETLLKEQLKEAKKIQADAVKALNLIKETETKALLKQLFDYEIPIAEVEKAGISTTGSVIENELDPLEIEFTAYRKTNKLWENPIEEVKYEIIGQDIFRMELGEPVAFYGK